MRFSPKYAALIAAVSFSLAAPTSAEEASPAELLDAITSLEETTSITASPAPRGPAIFPSRAKIHRYRRTGTSHFFRAGPQATLPAGWAEEGVRFHVFQNEVTNGTALFACQITNTDRQFPSLDAACEGQVLQSRLGYVRREAFPGSTPLHRCYNATVGIHLATVNPGECVPATGFADEGVIAHVPTGFF